MEIFNHTFVNAHIIGCSPVKKIDLLPHEKINNLTISEYYYQLDLYTTGGLHQFKSDVFTVDNIESDTVALSKESQNQNIKVNIWKEAADRYINFIESLNPSDYNIDIPGIH